MGRRRIYEVIKHMPVEEPDKRISWRRTQVKRLYFIYPYRGEGVEILLEFKKQVTHGLNHG